MPDEQCRRWVGDDTGTGWRALASVSLGVIVAACAGEAGRPAPVPVTPAQPATTEPVVLTLPDGEVIEGCPAGTRLGRVEPGQVDGVACVRISDGVKQGPSASWYASGAKKERGAWAAGQREGVWKGWYETGGLASEITYRAGVEHGPSRRAVVDLIAVVTMDEGRPHGVARIVDDTGVERVAIELDHGVPHGVATLKVDGEVAAEGRFAQGIPVGTWTTFHRGGGVASVVELVDGLPAGRFTRRGVDGAVQVEGELVGGVPHGRWRQYGADGVVVREGELDRGLRTGMWTERVGKAVARGRYRDGVWVEGKAVLPIDWTAPAAERRMGGLFPPAARWLSSMVEARALLASECAAADARVHCRWRPLLDQVGGDELGTLATCLAGGERCNAVMLQLSDAEDHVAAAALEATRRELTALACARVAGACADAAAAATARQAGLLQHGCDQAHATAGGNAACKGLARMLERGELTSTVQSALGLFGRGCDAGFGEMCFGAGGLLERGATRRRADGAAARRRYRQGCERKHALSCAGLAALLERGVGGGRDEAAATASFEQACGYGLATGCAASARRYGEGIGVTADAARAKELAARACRLGAKEACAAAE